jgi:hypothetical protein
MNRKTSAGEESNARSLVQWQTREL